MNKIIAKYQVEKLEDLPSKIKWFIDKLDYQTSTGAYHLSSKVFNIKRGFRKELFDLFNKLKGSKGTIEEKAGRYLSIEFDPKKWSKITVRIGVPTELLLSEMTASNVEWIKE